MIPALPNSNGFRGRSTQPTLTRNMKILEDHVGTPVLRRTTKGVEPTLIGRRLAERGRDILVSCGVAQESVAKWHKGQDQEIRVGVGPMPAVTFMGSFLEGHLGRRKSSALHIQVAPPSQLVALLDAGKVDIAIAPVQLTQSYAHLHQAPLFEDELAVLVRRDHPLQGLDEQALLEGLAQHEWMFVGSAGIDDGIGPELKKIGVDRPTPTLVLEGAVSMALHAISNSDLVATLPRRLVGMHRIGSELCILRLPIKLPRRDIAIWMHLDNRDKKDLVTFADNLYAFLRHEGDNTQKDQLTYTF